MCDTRSTCWGQVSVPSPKLGRILWGTLVVISLREKGEIPLTLEGETTKALEPHKASPSTTLRLFLPLLSVSSLLYPHYPVNLHPPFNPSIAQLCLLSVSFWDLPRIWTNRCRDRTTELPQNLSLTVNNQVRLSIEHQTFRWQCSNRFEESQLAIDAHSRWIDASQTIQTIREDPRRSKKFQVNLRSPASSAQGYQMVFRVVFCSPSLRPAVFKFNI